MSFIVFAFLCHRSGSPIEYKAIDGGVTDGGPIGTGLRAENKVPPTIGVETDSCLCRIVACGGGT